MIDGADLELFERSLRHATESHTGTALDAALDDLGWHDALDDDPRAAVSMLFELQGHAGATSRSLDGVLARALGVDAETVVLPPVGEWRAPGDGDRFGGLVSAVGAAAVVTRGGDAFLVEVDGRAVRGMDPDLRLIEVHGPLDGSLPLGRVDWDAAVALGQLALAHELAGASRHMLELAREHALDRVQFGRPIAAFQAVRHRLAETYVALELADAVLDAAWLERTPVTAAMAKATAGRSARTAAKHCQQVLAGIGFTREHPFHRFAFRVFVLEQLLGATKTLTKELGEDILRERWLPPLLPL